MMGAVAKHIFLVTDPARLESTMRTAFEIARTGRPGPVVVDIPKDVQTWEGVFQGEGLLPHRRLPAPHARARRRGAGCRRGRALLQPCSPSRTAR